MHRYVVTDLLTGETYPADDAGDVEEAVAYTLGDDMTETELFEFDTLLRDLDFIESNSEIVYDILGVSIKDTQ